MEQQVFTRKSFFGRGYDTEQVDEFFDFAADAFNGLVPADDFSFAQIRCTAFDLVRQGYSTVEVDKALDKLESAFVARDRENYIKEHGQDKWNEHLADYATTLYPRMLRPAGQRFIHPEKGQGYAIEEVDAFLDRLAAFFDKGAPLASQDVRNLTFNAKRRSNAYDEAVVDTYLARVLEILLAVE